MIALRAALPVVVLVAAPLASPFAAGAASVPNIAVWQGKTKQHKLGIFLDQVTAGKAVQVSVSVECKDASGAKQSVQLSASKLPKNGRVTLRNKRASPMGGTLTLSATTVRKQRSTGTLSYKLATSEGACTGKDTFSLKYSVSHGG